MEWLSRTPSKTDHNITDYLGAAAETNLAVAGCTTGEQVNGSACGCADVQGSQGGQEQLKLPVRCGCPTAHWRGARGMGRWRVAN